MDSDQPDSLLVRWFPRLKWGSILFAGMALTGGLFGSLTTDLNFIAATLNSAWSIIKVVAALVFIYLLVYFPVIWLFRRWWNSYRVRKPFQNDQSEKSLNKFIRNGPAMFGVITIIYALLIATFGYLIAPDSTKFANRQVLEIGKEKPGFRMDFLQVKTNQETIRTGLFERLVSGARSNHKEVPITGYEIAGDSIVVLYYRGKGVEVEQVAYGLIDVVYPTSFNNSTISFDGETYSFFNMNEEKVEVRRADLIREVERKNIRSRKFWFGTDQEGRDYLSRILLGTRISISVGFLAVTVALLIGLVLGSIAGFYRGKIDDLIMWFINVFWSIPTLLLVFPIAFAFGMKEWTIYLAVGLTMWVDIARIVRGQVLSVREMEYVDAARSLGFGNFRTIFKHILPNITGPVIVITAANFAYAILIEAGLSFLGIGAMPPKPTWGQMIAKNKDNIAYGDPHLALIPGFAIVLLVLSFFLIGNGLRDALDAKTKIDH